MQDVWEALSAIGTIVATMVALFLPIRMAKREWARQDTIRKVEAKQEQEKLKDMHQEVCSTVDGVLAYREAAMAIFDSQPPYFVGIQAVRRINLNAHIFLEILSIVEKRTSLADGALYSAVSAKRLATVVIEQTGKVISAWGQHDPQWMERKAALLALEELADMVMIRNTGVREHWHLSKESSSSKKIRDKYIPLAAAIKAALLADNGAPDVDLSTDYI